MSYLKMEYDTNKNDQSYRYQHRWIWKIKNHRGNIKGNLQKNYYLTPLRWKSELHETVGKILKLPKCTIKEHTVYENDKHQSSMHSYLCQCDKRFNWLVCDFLCVFRGT